MTSRHVARIHHINEEFNRRFGFVLYVASAVVVGIMMIAPYWGRIVLALFINVFFNRPKVYLYYLARLVTVPMQWLHSAVLFYAVMAPYGIYRRIFSRRDKAWTPAPPATTPEEMFYQS